MREIKFRVWCKQQEEMFVVEKMRFFSNGDFWYAEEKDHELQLSYFHDDTDFELMQYAGLKDKNGKEIYEGDILKLELIDWCGLECDLIVIDEKSFFSDVCYLQEIDKTSKKEGSLDSIEVIGNIYENQELLKGE